MDAPILKVQCQRTTSDCGIAVLAMLLGREYEEVLMAAAGVVPTVLTSGVTWRHLRSIARKLGFKTTIKKARNVSATDDIGALCVQSPNWKLSHLVVLKEGLIVDTDGCIYDADVYLSVNKARASSLMVFEPK